jgi:hypothetical protein
MPAFRKIGLTEASGEQLAHALAAVYMIPLAHNYREYLQGREEEPRYILNAEDPQEATEAITEFWRNRWLAGRIHQPGVLDAVSRHTRTYPILHGA